jgi:hypothetical protein
MYGRKQCPNCGAMITRNALGAAAHMRSRACWFRTAGVHELRAALERSLRDGLEIDARAIERELKRRGR